GSRVLVLATYREAELTRRHPLSQTLGELTRERRFQRVLLRGLSREDVERYIEVAAGIEPPVGLADAVHKQTEGNALFVTEVVRLLVQEGDLAAGPEPVDGRPARSEDSWTIRIPEGVRAAVGRRLDRLSESCNQTLTVASVVGREFGMDQLRSLSDDLSEDELLDVLEEALAARVIERLPQELGHYQFTHSLVQRTLVDELSPTQRVRLHARVAEALEKMWGPDASEHAAELADHFTEAAPVTGTERLARYSLLAGEHALDEHAFEEAVGFFQRALAAKEGQAMDDEQAALLFGVGKAQAALLRVQDARASLTRAFDYYVDVEDISRAVAVAEHPVGDGQTGVTDLVVRALTLVPPDSHEAGRLLSHRGLELGLQKADYEGAQEAFNQALAIAEGEGDVALEMWTLARAGRVEHYFLRPQECVLKDGQAAELNRSVDDPYVEIYARICVVLSLIITGDPGGAQSHADAMLSMAERTRYRGGLLTALWMKALVHLYKGEWKLARELYTRALSLNPYHPYLSNQLLFMEYSVGDFERGESHLERVLELIRMRPTSPLNVDAYIALLLADSMSGNGDRLEVAKEAVCKVLSSPTVTPVVTMEASVALGLIAVWRGDRAAAEEQYEALSPFRALFGIDESGFLSVDRLLGLLSVTMGQLDKAAAHFEDGLTFCRKAGYRPELAWTCCDYADMLLERDAEGDRQKATALLDESLAISSDLGMRPLMERVLSRKMSLQGIDVSSPETSIDAVVSAVEVERPNLQPHAAPDGTVTIMFTDIESFTPMNERLGDKRAQEVLRIHNALIRQQVDAHQGFEVKSQGDGFMVAFSSARRAVESAIAIQHALVDYNHEHPGEPIRVRIGLHTGEAIKEGEDFFGKTVILAARIASQASGGQILVSSLLKALVESSGEFEFRDGREVELKGLAGSHQVFDVRWGADA
ncbi:MAG: diguanylate cyclase, partial [Chloroflexi bacterium]|nr:diguanylate cyclase [Chloroflexota bacterium]